ncbi:hypothetical protein [Mycobacteroides abscessus]|uniref:hypothetical protein n=1 Tax=Mycobacteroides abscessus TaxID=36809 RepID=UPI000C25690E|nr:hypothetical protein [Mycobacteroides abscessus]
MSGRHCAYGLYFQYLVSLGFLLDMLDEPGRFQLRVDPDANPDDTAANEKNCSLQIVDFDVTGGDGIRSVVAQVKGAIDPATASSISAPDLAHWFGQLIASGPAESYQVITNRDLTGPAQRIADACHSGELQRLKDAWPQALASDFPDDAMRGELMKCQVVSDHRNPAEILRVLRTRIKELRIRARAGTGDESAGMLTNYLVGQLLYHGSGNHPDLITVEQVQQWLRVSPEELARTVGHYDWGIPIGVPFPGPTMRTTKLAELTEFFDRPQPESRASRLAVVHGLSGLGKSTLSAQYACDYADHYDFMWWVDCESQSSIENSLKQLASNISGLQWGPKGPSLDDLPTVLSKFAGQWLIVADNVYDRDIVRPWLPTTGCGDIIITTVDGTLWPHEYDLDLGAGFTDAESQKFLSDGLPQLREHTQLLHDLAETLAHWPLALSMAIAYVTNAQRDLRHTPRHHLEKFRSAVIRTRSAVDDRRYPRTLAAAISLVFDQVKERATTHPHIDGHDIGQLAVEALEAASYYAESDIPAQILWPSVFEHTSVGAEIVSDAIITLLRSGSLVQRAELIHELFEDNPFSDRITVNRITQDVIRTRFEAGKSAIAVARFLVELCGRVDQILQPAVEDDRFGTIAALTSHAEHVVVHNNRMGIVSAQLAALHGNLALCFSKHGRFDDSIALLEHELEILEEITGDIPVAMTLQTQIQLANVLIDAGRPFEEIFARITQTVGVTEYFEPKNTHQNRVLFMQWANLRSMIGALRKHQSDPRVIALRARIDRGASQLPARSGDAGTDDRIDWIVEIAALNNLLRDQGHEREVIRRARNAFNTCTIHQARIHLLGLGLEAHAYLGNTGPILNGLRELELFAQPMNVCVDTVVDALQNIGQAIALKLDSDDEYQLILFFLLQQSRERMPLAPANPNLQWFHHVLSALYFAYIGDGATAQRHLDAVGGWRPDDQTIASLRRWEQILAHIRSRLNA